MSKHSITVCDECHNTIDNEQDAIQLRYGTFMAMTYDFHKKCFNKLTPMGVLPFIAGLSDQFSVRETEGSTEK